MDEPVSPAYLGIEDALLSNESPAMNMCLKSIGERLKSPLSVTRCFETDS